MPGAENWIADTTSEPTSNDTFAGESTKMPKPASVSRNGIDLYACSLAVPPSAFQVSTTWPFLTKAVKRSPKP